MFGLLTGEPVPAEQARRGCPQPTLAGGGSLIDKPPAATVIVRVDIAALRRGHALAGDSLLAVLLTEAGDIRAVSHLGRTINKTLRTALTFRDRGCVVPHRGVSNGLEIDHVIPLEEGGPTELDNLAPLCHHHHFLKTFEGWSRSRTGPTDDNPGWTFEPQPPFGQEPGLGIDGPSP